MVEPDRSTPLFAVVGHPNKGKSSIVATLAMDDSVAIARQSGTTTRSKPFPMRIDGREMYSLVDTPGFQRARKALAWMKSEAEKVHERPQVVSRFVETWAESGKFPDECELLRPIIDGAGIIYVVDGSRPYGEEYEAEMEILRWSGRPSMALINPIDNSRYVEQWQVALNQYFKVVRTFNAITAEFDKRLEVLNGFGQLQEDWREPLQIAVDSLASLRRRQHRQAARAIAEMVTEMCSYTEEKKIASESDPERYQTLMKENFLNRLRGLEKRGRKQVEKIYQHNHLQSREAAFELLGSDLFATRDWYFWGLDKVQLTAISMAAGASAGLAVDAAAGGSSLLLGAAGGGLLGGAGVWLMADRISKLKVSGLLPIGGKLLTFGPVANRNFPYVLLGRALYHQEMVAGRAHAQRGELELEKTDPSAWLKGLAQEKRKILDGLCRKLSDQSRLQVSGEKLADWIESFLIEAESAVRNRTE